MSEPNDPQISLTGWWIGSYFERFDDPEAPAADPLFVHENFVLIWAVHFDEAFAKLEEYQKMPEGFSEWRGRPGQWSFAGFHTLLPVYEELEDGAEILWSRLEGYTNEDLAEMAMSRQALSENLTGADSF